MNFNLSARFGAEAEVADADVNDGRSDFDEDEIALLEADAARDLNDILADIAPPANENADQVVPYEADAPVVDGGGLHDVGGDVDDYQWMDEVNPFEFDGEPPPFPDITGSLDDDMSAEAESVGMPCSLTLSEEKLSAQRAATSDHLSPEKINVEDDEFKDLYDGCDLLFDVDLTCPMELAPLAVCRKFEFATMEYEARKLSRTHPALARCASSTMKASTSKNPEEQCDNFEHLQEESENDDNYGFPVPFHLVLTIRCPTSARNRLPPIYVYEAKSPTPNVSKFVETY